MFSKKRRQHSPITTLIGAGTRVVGDVEFSGGCLVDGHVKGNIRSLKDEDAILTISERGFVEGTVIAANVLLNGTVKGDVRVIERVELGSRARVIGNVQYRLIEMAIGAEVNGKLIHESESNVLGGSADEQAVRNVNVIGE